MVKSKVYFTKEITPASLVRIFEKLGVDLPGKVGVKISTGEPGGHNYLKPELIKELVQKVNGTIVECNTAYEGGRNGTEQHLQAARDHGFTVIAEVDIMDADGDIEIPIKDGRLLEVDIVGKHMNDYDSFINLAHFKGHQMGGFGGVLKNQSIGFASSVGKTYIHTAGKSRDLEQFYRCFDSAENMAAMLPEQDDFLEAMAESAKAVADYMAEKSTNGEPRIAYIDVMNNLSIDCDCSAHPEDPCMKDIGILASLDPVALDQAAIDLIWQSDDPGRDHFVERVERQHGRYILECAEHLGLGSREYDLEEI